MTTFAAIRAKLANAAIPAPANAPIPERSRLIRQPHYERRRNLLFDKNPTVKYTEWVTGIDLYKQYPNGIIMVKRPQIGREQINYARVAWLCDDLSLLIGTTDKLMRSPMVLSGDYAAGYTGFLSTNRTTHYDTEGGGLRIRTEDSPVDLVVDELLERWKDYGLRPEVRRI